MAKRVGTKKDGQKTLRMPTRTVFALEVCALVEKKSETAVNETAIEKHARRTLRRERLSMAELWHSNECVRWVNVYLVKGFPLDDDHAPRRDFVLQHRAFFTRVGQGGELEPDEVKCETLAAKLTEIDAYRALGAKDYWASGIAMAKVLRARNVTPPVWPPLDAPVEHRESAGA